MISDDMSNDTPPHAVGGTEPANDPSRLRSGIVAVVGRANVGKSSLVNSLVGEKVTIVSPVAQTTWYRIRAIRTEARGQIVLMDTPGVLKAESELSRWINRTARNSAKSADVVMLVVDGSLPPREEDEGWIRRLSRLDLPAVPLVIALNKSDLGIRSADAMRELWARAVADGARPSADPAWVECSAVTGYGLDRVLTMLFECLPVGPPLFPPDVLTDFPRNLFLADIIREKLFHRLRDELPHRVAVIVTDVRNGSDGALEVYAEIWVERSSQKPIVIGQKGRMLRAIRRAAEMELKTLFEQPVRVVLYVEVHEHWTRNYWRLKSLGLDL